MWESTIEIRFDEHDLAIDGIPVATVDVVASVEVSENHGDLDWQVADWLLAGYPAGRQPISIGDLARNGRSRGFWQAVLAELGAFAGTEAFARRVSDRAGDVMDADGHVPDDAGDDWRLRKEDVL